MDYSVLYLIVLKFVIAISEYFFKSTMVLVYVMDRICKTVSVSFLKSPVIEAFKGIDVFIAVIHYEIVWGIVHSVHQLMTAFKYCFAVAPCDGRRKKSGDFYIFLLCETMWNGNRVINDKILFVKDPIIMVE